MARFASLLLAASLGGALSIGCGGPVADTDAGPGRDSGGGGPTDAGPRADTGPIPTPPSVCTEPLTLVDTSSPDHVVGDGTAASCTAAALTAAVAAGGTITFDCGAEPVTLTLTTALVPTSDTTIDGEGTVTISGGGATRIVTMDTGNFEATSPRLTIQRLSLVNGRSSGPELEGGGGAIFFRGGSVDVIDSTFDGNVAMEMGPDVAGGAIYAIGAGALRVVGSTFSNNRASNGGALGALGAAVTIVNTVIANNTASGFGANYVEGGVQMGMGGNGGGLSMDGQGRELVICGATFSANESGAFGGAIFRTGYMGERNDIDLSTFDANLALDRTGMDEPSGAGGLYLQGVHVRITGSTISRNRARSSAGLWVLGHGEQAAIVELTNVTIAMNSTYDREPFTERGIGAGLVIGDRTSGTVTNCTIAANEGQFASAILNVSSLVVRNTILSNLADNEYTPLNCMGSMYAMPPGTGDHDVQWPTGLSADDMDCVPGITRVDPMMGTLGDHGGTTETMVPAATLEAGTDCPPTDQRGEPRDTASCSIGAVEL
jgi:hypothetical protein